MREPKFSVVIPAYNQGKFLGETIQSVLDQTFTDFEIIVVDDASPDNTAEIVKQFTDARIKYLLHPENRGLPAARNTGMRASSGDFIALLDADDLFHTKKLELHLKYLENHPEIGASFNSRFELNYSADTIRDIYRVNDHPNLKELSLGFPFAPSDMVIRREWAFKVDLFDEKCIYGAEDLDFPCRLSLEGCQFGRVDRALNYRRHHSIREKKNLIARRDDWMYALEKVFADPRCPDEVRNLRNRAFTEHYIVLVYLAFAQGETEIGQEFLREAIRLTPGVIEGNPSRLIDYMVKNSVADDGLDPVAQLDQIFSRFPSESVPLREKYNWAVGRGFLIKAVRAITWGRMDDGQAFMDKAIQWRADLDDKFIAGLVNQLAAYQIEFGYERTRDAIDNLIKQLVKLDRELDDRHLVSAVSLKLAFDNFHAHDYKSVPGQVVRAMYSQPKNITNRGLWSIGLRSWINSFSTEG